MQPQLNLQIKKKHVRTISGVAPLTVVVKPWTCPGKCTYCPEATDGTPKSYTEKSAPVIRGRECGWDAKKQTEARLKIFNLMGHPTEKVEVLLLGGTFPAYPQNYQGEFVKGIFDGLNGFASENLQQAKFANENAKHRCVGLCIETRPDWCGEEIINNFLDYGCTRVELGVQALDEKINLRTQRGHGIGEVVFATQRLKDSAYKVFYHWMIGLPGSTPEKDLEMFKELWKNPDFRSDGLKIYPTLVIKGTKLEKEFLRGEFVPYTNEQIVEIVSKLKTLVPRYCRLARIMRAIPEEYIVGGSKNSHLRDEIKNFMRARGMRCECLRCREAGFFSKDGGSLDFENVKLNRINYGASAGKEIFLSIDEMKNDLMLALLRLRIPNAPFRKEISASTALIREIHTFGQQIPIGADGNIQHAGFGKMLLAEAEKIALEEFSCKKILAIAGVGAREYFRKFGYENDGVFVSKKLC